MAKLAENGWPQVARLVLVEFYLDRATEAWRALQVLATATPNLLRLAGPVRIGAGARRRTLDANYRGTAWDWITVLSSRDAGGFESIVYNLDTRRARTEVRALSTQAGLVRELVARGSNDANRDPHIGQTLWKLLVPVEMEPFLGGTTEMLMELDRSTAAIPWELLDAPQAAGTGADPRPWSIRSKLVRKLRTATFRQQPRDASAEDSVLVIGEPLVDDPAYGPLPGARAEAEAVAERLAAPGEGVARQSIRAFTSASDDATTIVNALLERPYRVVHIAGHGAPAVPESEATPQRPASPGGVVLSGGHLLGPAEVAAMRVVPELVFLNCCHLAARDASTALAPYDRSAFAANLAEALIEVGVRCVVAAGWAVEDRPAEVFASTFYDALLDGARFLDAAATAREKAWLAAPDGNTWAAYQCYGDPAWRWEQGKGRARPDEASSRAAAASPQILASPGSEFGAVASPVALTLALETISIRLRFSGDTTGHEARREAERDRIRWLEESFGALWGEMGAVAEAFALARADAGDLDGAIGWGTQAVEAADGSASFRAVEQLGRNLARRGARRATRAEAHADIDAAIDRLERLVALQPTPEREAALGGAYKRLVLVEERFGFGETTPGRGAPTPCAPWPPTTAAPRRWPARTRSATSTTRPRMPSARSSASPFSKAGRWSWRSIASRRCATRSSARRGSGPTSGRPSARSSSACSPRSRRAASPRPRPTCSTPSRRCRNGSPRPSSGTPCSPMRASRSPPTWGSPPRPSGRPARRCSARWRRWRRWRDGAAGRRPREAQPARTSTRRGFACSAFGMRRLSTPSFSSAAMAAVSSSLLSSKLRRNRFDRTSAYIETSAFASPRVIGASMVSVRPSTSIDRSFCSTPGRSARTVMPEPFSKMSTGGCSAGMGRWLLRLFSCFCMVADSFRQGLHCVEGAWPMATRRGLADSRFGMTIFRTPFL
jgi:CHAT domain-containing protein